MPRLLFGDAGRQEVNVQDMIEFFGPKGGFSTSTSATFRATVPNFIECFIGEGNFDPAEVMVLLRRAASTASCSTTTCRTWTTTPTGTIAAARTRSATCRGSSRWRNSARRVDRRASSPIGHRAIAALQVRRFPELEALLLDEFFVDLDAEAGRVGYG